MVFVHIQHFDLDFYCFFWIGFFLNGSLNPFVVPSRPNYLFELNFHFSLVVFLKCCILTLIFGFLNFLIKFFSKLWKFYLVKILWIVRQDLSCFCLLYRRQDFCYNHMKSQPLFCSFVHAILTGMRGWPHFSLSGERIFCSFAWLNFGHTWVTSLSKMTSSLWNWLFFIYSKR